MAKRIEVEIIRDGEFVSHNNIMRAKLRGGPKSLRMRTKLGVAVPAGLHRYVSKASGVELALRIDPPPLPTWSFYAVAGGAVAATAAGGVFGLSAEERARTDRAEARRGAERIPTPARRLKRLADTAQGRANIANGAFIGAGSMAISAMVMAFFTDW